MALQEPGINLIPFSCVKKNNSASWWVDAQRYGAIYLETICGFYFVCVCGCGRGTSLLEYKFKVDQYHHQPRVRGDWEVLKESVAARKARVICSLTSRGHPHQIQSFRTTGGKREQQRASLVRCVCVANGLCVGSASRCGFTTGRVAKTRDQEALNKLILMCCVSGCLSLVNIHCPFDIQQRSTGRADQPRP